MRRIIQPSLLTEWGEQYASERGQDRQNRCDRRGA